MTAPDATLTGRLREALGEHQYAVACIGRGHCRSRDYDAHLADVAAQTVAAWLREQRAVVAIEIDIAVDAWDPTDPRADFTALTAAADAALAALVAAIGGAE